MIDVPFSVVETKCGIKYSLSNFVFGLECSIKIDCTLGCVTSVRRSCDCCKIYGRAWFMMMTDICTSVDGYGTTSAAMLVVLLLLLVLDWYADFDRFVSRIPRVCVIVKIQHIRTIKHVRKAVMQDRRN